MGSTGELAVTDAFALLSTGATSDPSVSLDTPSVFRILNLAVGAVGMIGNLMVIVVIVSSTRLRRTTTNKFICSQSALDFLASFFIVFTSFFRDDSNLPDGLFKELFCRFWLTNWPLWAAFVSSTYNLVAMTFERYVAIVFPLQHGLAVTKRRTYATIAVVWCIGPLWLTAYGVSSSSVINGKCTVYSVWPSTFVQRLVSVLTVVVQYLIPICSITFAYLHIFITLKQTKGSDINHVNSKREERMMKARRNVIKTLVQVFIVFIFCWSWNQIYFSLYNFGMDVSLENTFYNITVLFVFFNSCMNPFVYSFNYDQFKRVQRQIFCPCFDHQPHGDETLSSTSMRENTLVESTSAASLKSLKCLHLQPEPDHTHL